MPIGSVSGLVGALQSEPEGVGMSIKVIVELKAKPGQRDELISLIEGMLNGPPMPGSLGATFYKAVDDADLLVEIAE
ncbi:MAG: putative quinol monooxygenase [Ilumatobacteraceae bacterium]